MGIEKKCTGLKPCAYFLKSVVVVEKLVAKGLYEVAVEYGRAGVG